VDGCEQTKEFGYANEFDVFSVVPALKLTYYYRPARVIIIVIEEIYGRIELDVGAIFDWSARNDASSLRRP